MEDFTIRKCNLFVPIIILACIDVCMISELHNSSELLAPNASTELQEPTVLNVEILENQSMNWFRARLLLNITTDIPINMSYTIVGIGSSTNKVVPVNSDIFIVNNISSLLEIFIQPKWSVFPGSFQYQLTVHYINATTQIPQVVFEISGGIFKIIMGISLSIILSGVFILGIVVISVNPVRLRKPKTSPPPSDVTISQVSGTSSPSIPLTVASPPSGVLDSKYIQCPECDKKIAEGSAFCPECGYHIPRFLRTKG